MEEKAAAKLAAQKSGKAANDGGDDGEKSPRYTELITLKARDGEIGIDHLDFDPPTLTFTERYRGETSGRPTRVDE